MAEGDRPAVDVGDLVGDAEVGHRRQPDGRERLVELEQVNIADLLADLLERSLDGPRRLREQRRIGTGDLAVADDLTEGGNAHRLGLGLRGDDEGGATVGDLRSVAGGDVAGLVERRTQRTERLGGGAGTDTL